MIPLNSRVFALGNHASQAFQVMNELRVSQELCDVTVCIENQKFLAHKIVLAGCSPYLRAMFTNGMLETEQSTVHIRDIQPEVMHSLLDFMYTGSVEITTTNVQALMQGGSLLNITSLRNACCQFLQLHIDASNCLGIHAFADMYSCPELEYAARRYIYQHFLDIIRYDEFLQINEDKLLDLLQSDQLQVSGEEQVFKAAMAWLNFDTNTRAESLCKILQHIRLALLEIEFLECEVLGTEYVKTCAKCQNLVANAIRMKSDNSALALVTSRSQPQGIFVVGGRNSLDCQLKSLERYDFLRDQWIPMGNMTIARTAVGATTLNGLIYAIGGECAVAESQDETMYLKSNEFYDPIMKEWHKCADMKVARSFVSVCCMGGYIYALGGEEKSQSFSTVERYCCKTDTWEFMPNMKRKRAGGAVAVCDGKIYIAGGYDKTYHTDRASVECFDPETNEWNFVAEMEKARSGLALVAVDHYLYAFGGRSRYNDQYLNTVERYNTWTHQWTSVASMNTPRAWTGAAMVDNKIYILGGFDGSNRLRSVEMYSPELDSWTFISNMNVCRAGCGAAVL